MNAHLMDEEQWDLGVLKAKVVFARADYLHAADRKRRNPQAAHDAWKVYTHLLQTYRVEVRKNAST